MFGQRGVMQSGLPGDRAVSPAGFFELPRIRLPLPALFLQLFSPTKPL